ncbi:LOW QUALITY PROTEIN: translin-associated factor X-interacting protein 1-like [Podargus strigoides]
MAMGVNGGGCKQLGTTPESSSETPDCQTHKSLKCILSKKQKTPSLQLSARGDLSIWPVFASRQTFLRNHKPSKERLSSNKQALLTIPKPQYLEQLKSYLKKELQSLDMTKKNSQELKLQPYREVFEFFIDNFKTYKPLLSTIKNEYEVTLAHQKKTICALEPLKAMVTAVREECTQWILALQEKQKAEINMLKQEKQRLLKFIDNMREEKKSLQTQVEHLKMSVAEKYTHYLNHSARKLLLAKLNDMHNEQLDRTCHQVQGSKSRSLAVSISHPATDGSFVPVHNSEHCNILPDLQFFNNSQHPFSSCQHFVMWSKSLVDNLENYDCNFTVMSFHQWLLFKDVKGEEVVKLPLVLKVARQDLTKVQVKLNIITEDYRAIVPRRDFQWGYLAEGKTSNQLVDVLLEETGTGAVGEEQYQGQNELFSNLQKELAACDSSNSRALTSKQFRQEADCCPPSSAHVWHVSDVCSSCNSTEPTVRVACPLKRKEPMQELVDASRYKLDSTEGIIDYVSDEERNTDPFIAKLRSQYVWEKQEYLR